jgi:uncharacterized protein YwgA
MRLRDIVLYVIARCQDRSEFGRTSLQKVIYFLGRAMNRDFGYRPYFYGPFASPVERETEALVFSNLVEERVDSLGFANAAGFAAKRYEYTLTPTGDERIRFLGERHPQETKIIDEVIDALLEHAGGLDQRILSAAAKVDYIAIQESRPVSVEDVRLSAIRDLGWSLTEPQVEEVMSLLNRLGFVQVLR